MLVTGILVCNVCFPQSIGSCSSGKKKYVFQLGQNIYVQIVALVHRNNQGFGILNALHQEIIVSKGLFKKTNIS